MPRILAVDDDMFFLKVITKILARHGHEITSVQSGEEALQTLQTQPFDLMISDVNMIPMSGMELLQKTREAYPDMGVIMLTGHDEIEIAIEAMKKGAFDFLVKPFQMDELFSTVQRSLKYYNISPDNKPLQARLDMLEGLVAESASMRNICDMIRRVAPANVTVLLCGENGSDKEIIARTLHYYSLRKDNPFVSLDCAALSVQQIESEMFGSMNSAPAKAADLRTGLFKAARGGTLFLDNIDALPLDIQPRLLEVIQTGKITAADSEIDVRMVVASSKKLDVLAAQGAFHENLYYRLSALHIDIPPLRTRPEDIPLLIDQALLRNLKSATEVPALDPKAKEILYNYPWPGNIRELEEAVRHMLSGMKNGVITKEMLPGKIVEAFEEGNVLPKRRDQIKGGSFRTLLHEKAEKLLSRSVNLADGNKKSGA